jgi:hypothetical protein
MDIAGRMGERVMRLCVLLAPGGGGTVLLDRSSISSNEGRNDLYGVLALLVVSVDLVWLSGSRLVAVTSGESVKDQTVEAEIQRRRARLPSRREHALRV